MSTEQDAIDPGYELWGESATFTPVSGASVDCTVVVDHNLQQWGDVVVIGSANAVVSVRRSEVSERPRRGATFELEDGTVYRVDQPVSQTRYEYQLLAVEDES